MWGVIFGDVAGSKFEGCGRMNEEEVFPAVFDGFQMPLNASTFTDDTVLTVALAEALLKAKEDGVLDDEEKVSELSQTYLQKWGLAYPYAGYGGRFHDWLRNPSPYDSCGNGSAMRVSPAGMIAESLEMAKMLGRATAKVSHNHPEGIKGAECVAALTYLAGTQHSKEELYVEGSLYYDLDFHYYDRKKEPLNKDIWLCQGAVPIAIRAFLESSDYEDVIRKLIAFGGDTDTTCAIAGAFAGLYYQVPERYVSFAKKMVMEDARNDGKFPLMPIIEAFLADDEVAKKLSVGLLSDKPFTYVSSGNEGITPGREAIYVHLREAREKEKKGSAILQMKKLFKTLLHKENT